MASVVEDERSGGVRHPDAALVRIEHVNLTVSDPARSAAMLESVFGWQERWRGPSAMGGWTIHVGSGSDYVALYTHGGEARFPKGRPFNHLGVEVEDLDAVEARVYAAGLLPFSHGDYEPGRRFYFLDFDGIEYEVVSYRDVA
ncbi:VOC family protein [Sandaracinobacteroides hominis]|uniref:VOC family protein n=1 Tax=Sandaracinobacteroides hominis TaxID=2780086 RepID=UPI0018F655BC|nr:VOC family protein [Sandaracinobacteroides hominis]